MLSIRKELFIIIISTILLLCNPAIVNAQASVTPNPAEPGQTVTITNTNSDSTHRLEGCQIDGQGSYGNIGSGESVTFTIPANAQPGSSYTFSCVRQVSSSNDIGSSVPSVSIIVAEPPPQPTSPPPQPTAPNNNNGGDNSNNAAPSPTPISPTATPVFIPPTLPNDGQCYIATLGNNFVNIRQMPTLESDVVGQLSPSQVYGVTQVAIDDAAERWFVVNDGYVAAFVVRETAPCEQLLPDNIEATSSDVSDAFTDCPALFESATDAPVFILFEAADSDDPCTTLETLLNELLFGSIQTLSLDTRNILNTLFSNCSLQGLFAIDALSTSSDSETDTTTAPSLGDCNRLITYDGLSFFDLLSGISTDRDRILLGDLNPSEAAVRAVIEGECGLQWQPYGQEVLLFLLSITDTDSALLGLMGDICEIIDIMLNGASDGWFSTPVNVYSIHEQRVRNNNLTDDETRIRTVIEESCGIPWIPYGQSLLISQLNPLRLIEDLSATVQYIETNIDTFCEQMYAILPEGDRFRGQSEEIPAEVERIATGDLTLDEIFLREQLETVCSLYWEPYGRAALIQIVMIDSVALVLQSLETQPLVACSHLYEMLGLGEAPLQPAYTEEQQDTIDRIGRGELTDEEQRFRDFMYIDCAIAWEPTGREILLYLLNFGDYTSETLDELTIAPDAVIDGFFVSPTACDSLLDLVGGYLASYAIRPHSDLYDSETANYMDSRMSDRIERGELSISESSLRDALENTCNLSWALVGQYVLIELATSGQVQSSLDLFNTDPNAFCTQMQALAEQTAPLYRRVELGSLLIYTTFGGTDTEERLAVSGDYTPSEFALRGIIEHACGLGWNTDSFNILVNFIEIDGVDAARASFAVEPNDFCTSLRDNLPVSVVDNSESDFEADLPIESSEVDNSESEFAVNLSTPEAESTEAPLDPLTVFDDEDGEARTRIESGNATPDELTLLGFINDCGIFDPVAQELLIFFAEVGLVSDLIAQHSADATVFCDTLSAILSGDISTLPAESTETPDGTLTVFDDEDEDGEARTRIETGNATADETTLLGLINECGIFDSVAQELLIAIAEAGLVADSIAIQSANPILFCDEMNRIIAPVPLSSDTEPISQDTTPIVPAELEPVGALTTPDHSPVLLQIEQDGTQRVLFLDANGDLVDVLEGLADGALTNPAVAPDNDRVAMIRTMGESRQLLIVDFSQAGRIETQIAPVPMPIADVQPIWLDDGRLLVTVEENDSHAIVIFDPLIGDTVLWMSNATSPTIDARQSNVAFVRTIDGIDNIYTASFAAGAPRVITQEQAGCTAPAFGEDPFVLYYQCSDTLYRYGIGGVQPLVEGITHFAPSPLVGYVSYYDGEALYMLDEATDEANIVLSTDNIIQSMTWTQ